MIIIHAQFQITPNKEQAFLEEIRSLVASSREEEGNVSYDLMKDTEKESVYTMVEVWKDSAAVETHNTSKHFTSFVGRAPEYLAAPLDVKIYEANKVER
ncbi:antibiotic biosynthesis monooxygenase (plasmid) [Cytobacillus spongiae]|uniref:putative quinol monooxygenase n=1 Tax=Cytobacillus spongiae TaxID=2901381 RepID=UPI001F38945E|nr:putative quinol monooxygenase [Cytobacillus spongiae]UII58233.1 antibiotic biosynthesis monooxygenase [Cytobacillus spongiae]